MTDPRPGRARLEAALDHRFRNPDLLSEALTHRSAAGASTPSNERLEFLGDRVLGLVIAQMLMTRFPMAEEGEMSRRLTALVRREALAEVAERVDLAAHVVFGAGDAKAGRENTGLLANACEAVIGALFLDGGLEAARCFIERAWGAMVDYGEGAERDAKTRLQEWAQARGRSLPRYEVTDREGPAHAPQFVVTVYVDGESEATGEGASKRVAEQAAAAALLNRLDKKAE
ncbi:MAG: ribonuclease III [Hyphomicrobium sp.]